MYTPFESLEFIRAFIAGSFNWSKLIRQQSPRIYGFLLYTNEHKTFQSFIREAWSTLDKLSGDACDIIALGDHPYRDTANTPSSIIVSIGNKQKMMIRDDVGSLEVRDMIFKHPEKIILPGFVIFASPFARETLYYPCSNLTVEQLSDHFQRILNSIREVYKEIDPDRIKYRIFPDLISFDMFTHLKRKKAINDLKGYFIKGISKITVSDLLKIIGLVAGIKAL